MGTRFRSSLAGYDGYEGDSKGKQRAQIDSLVYHTQMIPNKSIILRLAILGLKLSMVSLTRETLVVRSPSRVLTK